MMEVEVCSCTTGLCYGFSRWGLHLHHRGLTAALAVRAMSELDHVRRAVE